MALSGAALVSAAPPVDFAREIQPLLASRCLRCHGPGEKEGGLTFATRSGALAKLESDKRAIVPGDSQASEILRRITSEDPDERMPPSGPRVPAEQVAKIKAWIEAGAEWPEHWAYRPLQRPMVPVVSSDVSAICHTPIDRFLAAKLAEKGLQPVGEADRRTLIRRLAFDLLGLPPTPEEVAEFANDSAPDAYERLVDRLLASPAFGERWARHWMDLVHFAETHGHDQDRPRENSWPYRDYLIRAFNADRPYARFVEQQIAGDILWPADPDSVVATGFLAAGPWDESSLRDIREDTLDREIGRYLDRDDIVTTVMSTFASSTVHCARCHDHKFDPISQADYYGLQAVFSGIEKANRPFDSDPSIAAKRKKLEARRARIATDPAAAEPIIKEENLGDQFAAWESAVKTKMPSWQTVEMIELRSRDGSTLTRLPDGSVLAAGTRPDKDVTTVVFRTNLAEVSAIRLEVLRDDKLPKGGPGRQDNGNFHLNEVAIFSVPAMGEPQKIPCGKRRADFEQQGWVLDHALDSNPATAWAIYPAVNQSHQAILELAQPLKNAAGSTLKVELHQVHGTGHLLGRFRLTVSGQPWGNLQNDALPANIATILATGIEKRSESQRRELATYWLTQLTDQELAAAPKPQLVYSGTSQFTAEGSFRPSMGPRKVMILTRGNLLTPTTEAQPSTLNCLPELSGKLSPADLQREGDRRVALAKWMSDPKNGLVWRSIANRLWQHHFGRGLVDSPNDFGQMGSAPSHPELLDWLAVELQEQGGSLKALHRSLVLSAAYRRASVAPPDTAAKSAAIDGDNRLLWRQNRRRLDAESIHDAALVASDQLDRAMGGPSVKQFVLSPGVHVTPNVDYDKFPVDDPAHRRRSVYRFLFRTIPDPLMEALDCPDASQLAPQRSESVTALQALATLNDKFLVRQSEHLAQRLEGLETSLDRRIAIAYHRLFGREPRAEELAAVRSFAQQHGVANACRVLMNSNEFLFVD